MSTEHHQPRMRIYLSAAATFPDAGEARWILRKLQSAGEEAALDLRDPRVIHTILRDGVVPDELWEEIRERPANQRAFVAPTFDEIVGSEKLDGSVEFEVLEVNFRQGPQPMNPVRTNLGATFESEVEGGNVRKRYRGRLGWNYLVVERHLNGTRSATEVLGTIVDEKRYSLSVDEVLRLSKKGRANLADYARLIA